MTSTNVRAASNSRRGQALVESALVTLVFVVVLIGVMDMGQVMFVHQTMTERSRNAVRYGAVRPYNPVAIRNMFLYDQPTVPGEELPDGDQSLVPGLFDLDASMVQVARMDADTAEDRIVLTIANYPFRLFTPFIAGSHQGRPIVTTMPHEGG